MKAKLLSVAALGLLVAACGTNPQDRVAGGAAAGAATGAVVGSVAGPVGTLAGAGIGAGAGAVTGAVTSPSDVNLGRPVWNNPEVRTPADGRTASSTRSSGRHGMASRSHRSGTQNAAATSRSRPAADRDRAYMGGGMVVGQSGTGTSTGTMGSSGMTGSGMGNAPASGVGMGATTMGPQTGGLPNQGTFNTAPQLGTVQGGGGSGR